MQDNIPGHMIDSLACLPDSGVVLLIRHSLRHEGNNRTPGFDVPLTEAGRALAHDFGNRIGRRLCAVHSSASPRCIDTGEAMLQGAGVELDVQVNRRLREPGCYVTRMQEAGRVFVESGPLGFVNRVLSGEAPGTRGAVAGSRLLAAWLESLAPEPNRITLCITHDTILGTFVHSVMGKPVLAEEDWPQMLEGLFLWFEGARLIYRWRGSTASKPYPL